MPSTNGKSKTQKGGSVAKPTKHKGGAKPANHKGGAVAKSQKGGSHASVAKKGTQGGGSTVKKTKKAVDMTTALCPRCKKVVKVAKSDIATFKRRGGSVGKMLKGTGVCGHKVFKIVG